MTKAHTADSKNPFKFRGNYVALRDPEDPSVLFKVLNKYNEQVLIDFCNS